MSANNQRGRCEQIWSSCVRDKLRMPPRALLPTDRFYATPPPGFGCRIGSRRDLDRDLLAEDMRKIHFYSLCVGIGDIGQVESMVQHGS